MSSDPIGKKIDVESTEQFVADSSQSTSASASEVKASEVAQEKIQESAESAQNERSSLDESGHSVTLSWSDSLALLTLDTLVGLVEEDSSEEEDALMALTHLLALDHFISSAWGQKPFFPLQGLSIGFIPIPAFCAPESSDESSCSESSENSAVSEESSSEESSNDTQSHIFRFKETRTVVNGEEKISRDIYERVNGEVIKDEHTEDTLAIEASSSSDSE